MALTARAAAPAASRDRAELAAAAVAAALAGLAVAAAPVVGLALLGLVAALLAAAVVRLSPAGGAVVLVVLGQAVSGQLYVLGLLPAAFALLLDGLVALLFLAAIAVRGRGGPVTWLLLGYAGLTAAQVLNPLVPSLAYGVLGARTLALAALVIIAVRDAPLTRRDVHAVTWALVAGWVVNVALAARQWLGNFTGAELRWVQDLGSTYLVGDQIRLLGAMRSNQDFAFLAALALPAVCILALRAPRGPRRVALVGLAAVSVAVLFGSLVRSGLVGGVVGATVALVAAAADVPDRRRILRGGLIAALALWAVAAIAPGVLLPENKAETLTQRVTSIFSPSEDFAFNARREETWPYALEQIEAHPLGAGPGSAGSLSQTREDEAPLGRVVPDNGYLLVAVQLGLPGLVLFMVMLGALFAALWRRARAGNAMAQAAAGALAATMVAMLAGSYWSLVAPVTILGVLCGLGLREPGFQEAAA